MDVPLKITQPMTGQAGARGYHRRKAARDRRAFLLFVAPAVFAFALMMLWPLVNMFYLRLVGDRHFHRALANTGIHILVSMPGVMLPAFILGFFLSQRRRGYRLLRIIFFSPAM